APVVSVDAAGTTTAEVEAPKPVPPLPPAAIVAEAAPGETPVPTEVPPQTPVEQLAESKDKPAETAPAVAKPPPPVAPATILSIDIGGTKVKFLATGQTEPRKAPSGKEFTPTKLVETVAEMAKDWEYEALTIGYPGLVGPHGPRSEPGNLGAGWVGFDFAAAFGKPVKMINDAAMQALGSYEGGRMLFLGFGTGLGSALIAENVIVPLELGQLPYRKGLCLGDLLGRRGLPRAPGSPRLGAGRPARHPAADGGLRRGLHRRRGRERQAAGSAAARCPVRSQPDGVP